MTDNEFILFDRCEKIKSVIKKYGEENFYISFSGGKDSTVLSELIDYALPNNRIPRVFVNTGIEYKLIVDFVRKKQKQDSRFIIIEPSLSIKATLEIYKYPYNFERTGCKGCPFNPNLQKDLDTLKKYFPAERKQCEYIWKPIYDEYRRIGYRLKK